MKPLSVEDGTPIVNPNLGAVSIAVAASSFTAGFITAAIVIAAILGWLK